MVVTLGAEGAAARYETDVVVVGGIASLATAVSVREAGRSVILIEKATPMHSRQRTEVLGDPARGHSSADYLDMDKRGDPQVIVFLERSVEFARRLEFEQARIAALRSELDGLWASEKTADGDVTWTFRPRFSPGRGRSA